MEEGGAKANVENVSAKRRMRAPPNALVQRLPEICAFLTWCEQAAITLVCKEFTETLRSRPDRDRAVNMVEVAEEWCKRNHIPSFCYVSDHKYIASLFESSQQSKSEGVSFKRPLWLLGGLLVRGNYELKPESKLTFLELQQVSLKNNWPRLLPRTLVELKLVSSKVYLDSVEPVQTLPRVKKVTQVNTVFYVGQVPQSCAVAVLFCNSLEELMVEHEVRFTLSSKYKKSVLWMIYHLNKAQRLKKLSLIEYDFPTAELFDAYRNSVDALHTGREAEWRVLNLPLLSHLTMRIFLPRAKRMDILRECNNLEVVDIELREIPSSQPGPVILTPWRLTDLPRLSYVSVYALMYHSYLWGARVSFHCERNKAGQVAQVKVHELSIIGTQVDLLRDSDSQKDWRWLYDHGFLSDNVEIRYTQMNTLRLLPSKPCSVDKLIQRVTKFEHAELHEISNENMYTAFSELHLHTVEELLAKPPSMHQHLLAVPIMREETEYRKTYDILAQAKLRSVSLVMCPSTIQGPKEGYDFTWLQGSRSSLESFKITNLPEGLQRYGNQLQLESFELLRVVTLRNVALSKLVVVRLGLLPALETLSLWCASLTLEHENTDLIRKLSSESTGLFSALRSFYAEKTYFPTPLDRQKWPNAGDISEEFQFLIAGKSLKTIVLAETLVLNLGELPKLLDPGNWIRGCSLNNCVDLDLSGCDTLVDLTGVDAPQLKRLVLNGCPKLHSLDGIERSPLLEILIAKLCVTLACTSALKDLKMLRVVNFEGCKSLRTNNFVFVKNATSLMYVNLKDCSEGYYLQGVALFFLEKKFKLVLECNDFNELVSLGAVYARMRVDILCRSSRIDPFIAANKRVDCSNSMDIKEDERDEEEVAEES